MINFVGLLRFVLGFCSHFVLGQRVCVLVQHKYPHKFVNFFPIRIAAPSSTVSSSKTIATNCVYGAFDLTISNAKVMSV